MADKLTSIESKEKKEETKQTDLFTPYKIRSVEFRNRICLPPMCLFVAEDGKPTDFHIAHYGARAMGGMGMIIVEATAVLPEGRICGSDLGLWKDDQVEPAKRITKVISSNGCIPFVQLAHAGRKGNSYQPWIGRGCTVPKSEGGFDIVAPTAEAYSSVSAKPKELTTDDIKDLIKAFSSAAERAIKAGYQGIEIHAAHGYLLNQFLSPMTNKRTDDYGGSFEKRCRLLLEVVEVVRKVIGEKVPLLVRLSCTDWLDEKGGWTMKDTVALCKKLKSLSVDLIDCSSGGIASNCKYSPFDGYQVPFAEEVRKECQIATGAVGLITKIDQANKIITSGQADIVLLGRELLRNPNWTFYAAHALKKEIPLPKPYSWCTKF
eukprot:TRINITY_DN11618_c0_g1_i1.p1 TRINITY_DN11618_c0_g1~~TRINITY_DN11618_c0_g1_i1.p1  ORF type:complete len:391 (+),score=99.77 TRINITY_DN11618_c0_g1_i1:43-1173(+)